MSNNRGFEIIEGYEGKATLPVRKTRYSAGYDISAAGFYKILPGDVVSVDTGITSYMQEDEFLSLHVRSGLAKVHRLGLQNQTGIVDMDYYGKPIMLLVKNEGESTFLIKPGDRICQGVFKKYLLADDDNYNEGNTRTGGFGSTGMN
jgi:dUTP pyrophosphatase